MPGSTPPTSQLDWLSSTTAMIVLFWSRATRDLLKSFGWGIAALHSVRLQRRSCHVLAARPIGSCGSGFQGNVSSIPLSSRKLAGTHSRFDDQFGHPTGFPVNGRFLALTCRYSGDQRMAKIAPFRSLPSASLHKSANTRGHHSLIKASVHSLSRGKG